MKYNDLINELLDLLDKNSDIKNIKILKNKLINDKELKSNIENYQITKSIEIKKKLFQNSDYLNYLKYENNLNLLIHDIKNKFVIFNNRKCNNESN